MKPKLALVVTAFLSFAFACAASAQDLPTNIRKIKEGIYVYVGNNFNSNCGIVITEEGVVRSTAVITRPIRGRSWTR